MYIRSGALLLLLLVSVSIDAFVVPPAGGRRAVAGRLSFVGYHRVLSTPIEEDTPVAAAAAEEETTTVEIPESSDASAEEEAADSNVEATAVDDSSADGGEVEGEAPQKRRIERERHTLWVGNLPFDVADAEIKDYFSAFGKVELVSLPRDRDTRLSRGFAFVDMSSPEEVEVALQAASGAMFGGRPLKINKSLPKEEVQAQREKARQQQIVRATEVPPGYKKLYVGNFPFDVTKQEVADLFSRYTSEVREVILPFNVATQTSRGFGFIVVKEEDADNVIESMDGAEYGGRDLTVSVPLERGEKAQRRNNRRDRTKIYVGNLSFYTVTETIVELFEEFGPVVDCYLPEEADTGRARGFAFVTMDKENAVAAIADLDGCELDGRIIRVNEAQPRTSRPVVVEEEPEEEPEEPEPAFEQEEDEEQKSEEEEKIVAAAAEGEEEEEQQSEETSQ